MSDVTPYLALALQTAAVSVNDAASPSESRPRMMRTLDRISRQLAAAKRFIGPDLKLVVLPEYALTGFPMGEPAVAWRAKSALALDGPEYQALGQAAQTSGVYLAGNAYEQDPHFPELYFQASFLIEPSGKVVLRYRRLVTLFGPSPYDVYDRYVEAYGADALFPVVDTELGRLAAIASEEILYPEIARAFALRGAEVLVHSSSEVGSPMLTPKNVAKQARAIENLTFLVSANSAGVEGIDIPRASTDAGSKIVDYRGLVLAEAGYGESIAACAEIDLAGLRRYRRRPGMGNLLSRQPVGLWAEAYAGREIQPRNSLLDSDGGVMPPSPAFYADRQRKVIAKMQDDGLI